MIYDRGDRLLPFEIKSGATFQEDFLKNLRYWNKLYDQPTESHLIMNREINSLYKDCHIHSWKTIGNLLA